jgi:hypothetical protein
MYAHKQTITLTTIADGTGTAYSQAITGQVLAVYYTKVDFSNGSTMTLEGETTGEHIWSETAVNASAVRRPRLPYHDAAGAEDSVAETYVCVNERLKWTITGGGSVTSGTLVVVIG